MLHLTLWIDDETISIDWISPQEALDKFIRKQISLAPPTWFILNQLASLKTLEGKISQIQWSFLSFSLPFYSCSSSSSSLSLRFTPVFPYSYLLCSLVHVHTFSPPSSPSFLSFPFFFSHLPLPPSLFFFSFLFFSQTSALKLFTSLLLCSTNFSLLSLSLYSLSFSPFTFLSPDGRVQRSRSSV